MAKRLVDSLPTDLRPVSVLELGCGTGHLTRTLTHRFPRIPVLATDLSEAMLQTAREHWDLPSTPSWQRLDARIPELPGKTFDLVASNALVQWFGDLEEHFRGCRELATTKGWLAVSGFCDDHFPELDRILTRPPFEYPRGPGHAIEAVAKAVRTSGWELTSLEAEEWPVSYPSSWSFLGQLRDSGANRHPLSGRNLGRSGLRALLERMDSEASGPEGIRVTWKPWFLRARAV
jgi:malonyl-CoA O-methyltransferase